MLAETLLVISIEIPPPEVVPPPSPYSYNWWEGEDEEPVAYSGPEEDFRKLLDIMLMERLDKFGD